MDITFAVPWKGHEADSSADIDDDVAGQLIRDGWARRYTGEVEKSEPAPEPEPVDQLPPPPPRSGKGSGTQEWVDYASAHGVAVAEGTDRADVIKALDAAGVPTGPPAQPDSPDDSGDNKKEE